MKRHLSNYPSFRTFLTTGQFGPICIGTPITKALTYTGTGEVKLPYWDTTFEQDDETFGKHSRHWGVFGKYGRHWQAWYCGNLDLVSSDGQIVTFDINNHKRLRLPRHLYVQWNKALFSTSLDDIINLFNQWEISHQFLTLEIAPEEMVIIVPLPERGNIYIFFDDSRILPWRVTVNARSVNESWVGRYEIKNHFPDKITS